MLACLIWLLWLTCLLDINIHKKKKSFVVHPKFNYNKHRPMINLKELTLINEAITHLRCKTLKYIKLDPYVHLN